MVFFYILEHTMVPIFLLVLIGFYLDKKFSLDVKTLSKLLFYLIIPSFVFTNLYKTDFPATSAIIISCIFFLMFIGFLVATFISKMRHYDACMLESCRNALMFNNSGNLGVALVILVFSHDPFVVNGQTPYLAEAMVVQILIFVIQNITLNTIGLYQAGRGRLSARDTLGVVFRMPIIYVFTAALVARFSGWDATQFFFWPIMEMSGAALLPVAMISIGIQLHRTTIKWLDHEVWLTSIVKLMLFPFLGLATIYAANLIIPGSFSPVASIVFLIYCSVPVAVNTAMYAIEFNNCPEYATQVVMNTTALSAFTMTFFIFLGHLLFI
ncbi:transporter [Megasphaera paucivorans]|uniref:Transporter n=1 Tax=Megasphaera paucivorans TaxID=349095 RepID=A0A1G9VN80_9FIRM|nr:AEC family transporter [Megasphaera paucivorans]SDM73546.1 hypothetical protein SAMN05660299_01458 [Megasphaera paucivorans]